ncbi:MAG: hypothetical protein IJ859_09010 [Synergistaceae bacterium]|nr:hypothetical protein [Synergistaceae bacterium]
MKHNVKFFAVIIFAVLFLSSQAKSAEHILPQNISNNWNELTGTLSFAFSKRDMPVKPTVKNNASLKAQEERLRDSLGASNFWGSSNFENELTKWTEEFETGAEAESSRIADLKAERFNLIKRRANILEHESSWFGKKKREEDAINARLDEIGNELSAREAKLNRINQAVLRQLKATLNESDDKASSARYKSAFAKLEKQIQDNISALELENERLRENSINKLLDKAIELLTSEEVKNFRHKNEALKQTLRNLQIELDTLQNQQLSARGNDLDKITKRITEIETQIPMTKQRMKDSKAEMIETLEKTDLKLTSSQWNHLFTFVTGDDYLQNATIFENVKSVMEQLASLMRANQGNLEIENRYLGIRIVLYDLLIYMYNDFITKIDNKYIPQLNKLLTEAEGTYKMSLEAAKRYNSDRNKKAAERAVQTTEKLLKAGKLYVDVLKRQRESAERTLSMLREDRDFQELYYQVEQSASAMVILIETGLEHFESIQKLSIPELEMLDDNAVADELDTINEQLQAMTASD